MCFSFFPLHLKLTTKEALKEVIMLILNNKDRSHKTKKQSSRWQYVRQLKFLTSLNDVTVLRWLKPRSRCFSLAHLRRLSTFVNLLRLRSRVSTAGRSCKDSSMSNMPLHAHETNESRFHCGESFISAILLAKTCRKAS